MGAGMCVCVWGGVASVPSVVSSQESLAGFWNGKSGAGECFGLFVKFLEPGT